MIVVDASVWISDLFPDDVNHDRTHEWFATLPDGEELLEPRLLVVEIADRYGTAVTGNDWTSTRSVEWALANPRLVLRSMTDELVDAAATLAASLRLQYGDAIYVALAHLSGARLVSWDREQIQRARAVVSASTPEDDLAARI